MKKMEATITAWGVELAKASLPPPVAALIRKDLTVAPLSLNDPFPKKFKVYLDSPAKYVVPLHWALAALAPFKPRYVDARPRAQDADLTFAGQLKPELGQPEAARAVEESWARCGGAMLCLAVGYGKTVLALYLAARLRKKTLVLVHKAFLKDQWKERVAQCLPGATVSEVQGDTCDTSGDVVVAMIQTLVSRKYPPATFAGVGCVIVDEVHHLGAQAFSQCMWGLCAPRVLGLSATPERKDGLTRVVSWFVGPVAFRLRRENQDTTRVKVVKYACAEYDGPPPVNRRGDVCFTTIITRLAQNAHRTAAVAREAADLAAQGRHVLVLTHRRQHAFDLAEAVRRLGAECGTYVGGDKEPPDARVIVATYALTSEGFDLPRLDALVLATPASDVEQSCGRVMRGSATRGAVIVDVVDQWGVCFSQHAKRRGFYKRSGFSMGGAAAAEPSPPPQFVEFAFVD